MARNPLEKDMIDGLRDVRAQLATLNRVIVSLAESIDIRFDAIEADNKHYRETRLAEEVEQLEIAHKKKLALYEDQKTNGTTSKMKAVAAQAVKEELETKQIDWGNIFRKNVIPAIATAVTIGIVWATLAVIAPGLIEIIQKAFIK